MQLPKVIESLNAEEIFTEKLSRFTESYQRIIPEFRRPTPADPVYHIFSELALAEILIREKINEAALSQLLRFTGELDFLFSGQRREGESDDQFRVRMRGKLHLASPAGSKEMYRNLALISGELITPNGHIKVMDAYVEPAADKVLVYIQPSMEAAPESKALMEQVATFLNSEGIRPALDKVEVRLATLKAVNVQASFRMKRGFGQSDLNSIEESFRAQWSAMSRLGWRPALSWITRELHGDTVESVSVKTPIQDIDVLPTEYAVLNQVSLTIDRGSL